MNLQQFLFGLIVVYAIYYSVNIIYDLFRGRNFSQLSKMDEKLTFDEIILPQKLAPTTLKEQDVEKEVASVIPSGTLQYTGGVSMKELVSLAQSNLIEYTRAIPY